MSKYLLCVYIHRCLKVVTEKVTTGQGTVPIQSIPFEKDTRELCPFRKGLSNSDVKMHGLSHSGSTPVSFYPIKYVEMS